MPMSPRTLRPSQALFHPEAQDWRNRVIANSGSVSLSTLRAVSAFCRSIDAAGIRDRFIRLNLFAGTGLNACLVPLYRGQSRTGSQVGNATDTNSNFVSGDYVETGASGGLLGNGTTKQLTPGLTPNDVGADVGHVSAYIPTQTATTQGRIIGAGTVSPGSLYSLQRSSGASNIQGVYGDAGRAVVSVGQSGHYIVTRESGTSVALYENGLQQPVNTLSATSVSSTFGILVFARNFGGSVTDRWASRILCYSLGGPMTNAQASSYYTAIQAFQTALGRNA